MRFSHAAQQLGLSPKGLAALIRRGEAPLNVVHLGALRKNRYLKSAELKAWLASI